MPARLLAVNAPNPTERASFVPEFTDYPALRGQAIGLTGARGVLGRLLKERLDRQALDAESYPGDINDGDALAKWFSGRRFRYFFHFAALVPVTAVEGNPLLAYQTNVIGTFNVCKQLLEAQPGCWLFHCSSSHVYQPAATPTPLGEDAPKHPPTFYGATKLAAEQVVETLLGKLKHPYCIGRVFSFTHERQSPPYLVPTLRQNIAALRDGDVLKIDNPSAVRDIQDAEEVIDTVLHLAQRAATGTVNIGTGVGRSVADIALSVAEALGKKIRVEGTDRAPPGSLIADTTRLRALLAPAGARRGTP
jgi:UDP-glucose 4-epimerase/GDP-4-dehydro-6-deoxy-D-mannose reductase